MLEEKKGGSVPYWMHFVDWFWMSAMMIFWLVLIGGIGYAVVLLSLRHTSRHERPKSA
jgi:hypothetical protein